MTHIFSPSRQPRWPAFLAFILISSVQAGIQPRTAFSEGLSLDSCLARATSNNPALRATDREVSAAQARLRQAGALDAPSVSYSVGKLGTAISSQEHDASIRLSQDLSAPGQRGHAVRVARIDAALRETNRESFALKLRGDVTRSYRRLQADMLVARALESLRGTATDLERMVGARLRTGGARYLDVLRARAERVRIENDMLEADRVAREDRRGLNALMARAPDEPLEPSDSLVFRPLTDSLSVLIDRVRTLRPRLIAARLEVTRATAGIAFAKNGLLPAATLSAGLDRVPGADRLGFGGEISFSLPFVPWSDRRAKIAEAHATQQGSVDRMEATDREVETAIRNAYGAARTAGRQVEQFDRLLLADASDAIRTAVQNYQAGQIDGLELFETLRTFRSIRLEYIRALLNYELSLTDLAVAE